MIDFFHYNIDILSKINHFNKYLKCINPHATIISTHTQITMGQDVFYPRLTITRVDGVVVGHGPPFKKKCNKNNLFGLYLYIITTKLPFTPLKHTPKPHEYLLLFDLPEKSRSMCFMILSWKRKQRCLIIWSLWTPTSYFYSLEIVPFTHYMKGGWRHNVYQGELLHTSVP